MRLGLAENDPEATRERHPGLHSMVTTEASCPAVFIAETIYRNPVAIPVSAGRSVASTTSPKQLITLTGNWANPTKFGQAIATAKRTNANKIQEGGKPALRRSWSLPSPRARLGAATVPDHLRYNGWCA